MNRFTLDWANAYDLIEGGSLMGKETKLECTADYKLFDNGSAEFLGTVERDGQICDYYQMTNEIEKYFYYVLRKEEKK